MVKQAIAILLGSMERLEQCGAASAAQFQAECVACRALAMHGAAMSLHMSCCC
jgi:hypothetical protein